MICNQESVTRLPISFEKRSLASILSQQSLEIWLTLPLGILCFSFLVSLHSSFDNAFFHLMNKNLSNLLIEHRSMLLRPPSMNSSNPICLNMRQLSVFRANGDRMATEWRRFSGDALIYPGDRAIHTHELTKTLGTLLDFI